MPDIYTVSITHPACSYGNPVLLDRTGAPNGAADVGLFGLPANYNGRVDAGGKVYWSGYGDDPMKMWHALRRAVGEHPDLTTAIVHDSGRIELA
jgi:hypothetical protein